ncbi:MAG: 30S ribosomal protein S12 methylthiotransferase RimO [Propionibacteriaceae bacterium]|nr:30S ribosomal protein S12 methylthiotransferase RimO [Propionibacteriaceae bacterium]
MATTLHLVGLGCVRNDVDTEELAARLAEGGFELVDEPGDAEVVVVNTCGFIDAAKQDSIDQILAAADLKESGRTKAVVATGCLAQRYGAELAAALPEADAVVGFDGYADIAATVRSLVAPRSIPLATPTSIPLVAPTPLPFPFPRRLTGSPMAPLKIATGCDRRCAFCAIPAIRGPLRSRAIPDVVAEARWLAEQGVRELFLVSENTTAYGKDLGADVDLPGLLAALAEVDVDWIRLSYLQPAELRPALVDAVAATAKVVPYFDLPVQHASRAVLRRMRRFGDPETFLALLDRIRQAVPDAGVRTNVIAGFPGETDDDVAVLRDFLAAADFDAIGVFGYSDEEGTPAAELEGHVDDAEIAARAADLATWADHLMADRARRWVGRTLPVLVEGRDDGEWRGRTPQQGPESDGETTLGAAPGLASGQIVSALIRDTLGVDLIGSAHLPAM